MFFPATAAALDRGSIVFLDKEMFGDLPVERCEADLVVRANFREQPSFFLIHVEHQAQADPFDFPRRMFGYFARLHEQHSLPVYPIAPFSYAKPRRPEPGEYRVVFADREVLTFRYQTVQLNRLDWRDFRDCSNPVAAALLARMHHSAAEKPTVLRHAYEQLLRVGLPATREYPVVNFLVPYLPLSAEEKQGFRRE